jgi:hypothetical protein
MYSNINAIATAGKTRPVRGTKMEGKNEAAIVRIPVNLHYISKRAYCKFRDYFYNSQDF